MQRDLLTDILTARVYDVAIESPLDHAPCLSRRLDNRVLLKREDLQPVFSFKLRGAYNKMASLSADDLKRGVVTASAGNHAQGVALAAQKLGCEAVIVMPATTPQIKVNAVTARGGKAVLHGDSYDAAFHHAMILVEQSGATYIPPFDDPLVIAGQGTVGMELLRQDCNIDAIFIPVGGGGLIAGVAAYVKRLRPHIKIIGVEPFEADAMYQSLQAGCRVQLDQVGIFADGVAVKLVGEQTFSLCQQYVDEIIRVDSDAICAAIKDVFDETRSILEPSGALSIAGLKVWVDREQCQGRTLVAIASGANMNFDRLRHIAERAELGEKREAIIAVTIPEAPGSFRGFCQLLGARNITEFNYRYSGPDAAHVFVGVSTSLPNEAASLVAQLEAHGLAATDLSDNEMAKLHVRHLVGGRAALACDELLYRFEFPERPGALMKFLNAMNHDWNISLFHYRNHGTDFGRVLAGIQVPASDLPLWQAFLDQLGYPYWDESANPAYHLFLR